MIILYNYKYKVLFFIMLNIKINIICEYEKTIINTTIILTKKEWYNCNIFVEYPFLLNGIGWNELIKYPTVTTVKKVITNFRALTQKNKDDIEKNTNLRKNFFSALDCLGTNIKFDTKRNKINIISLFTEDYIGSLKLSNNIIQEEIRLIANNCNGLSIEEKEFLWNIYFPMLEKKEKTIESIEELKKFVDRMSYNLYNEAANIIYRNFKIKAFILCADYYEQQINFLLDKQKKLTQQEQLTQDEIKTLEYCFNQFSNTIRQFIQGDNYYIPYECTEINYYISKLINVTEKIMVQNSGKKNIDLTTILYNAFSNLFIICPKLLEQYNKNKNDEQKFLLDYILFLTYFFKSMHTNLSYFFIEKDLETGKNCLYEETLSVVPEYLEDSIEFQDLFKYSKKIQKDLEKINKSSIKAFFYELINKIKQLLCIKTLYDKFKTESLIISLNEYNAFSIYYYDFRKNKLKTYCENEILKKHA